MCDFDVTDDDVDDFSLKLDERGLIGGSVEPFPLPPLPTPSPIPLRLAAVTLE